MKGKRECFGYIRFLSEGIWSIFEYEDPIQNCLAAFGQFGPIPAKTDRSRSNYTPAFRNGPTSVKLDRNLTKWTVTDPS